MPYDRTNTQKGATMAQATSIASTRPNVRPAEQSHIIGNFIFLDVAGQDESFTVPMRDEYRDGQLYTAIAESVLGGVYANVSFRFIR